MLNVRLSSDEEKKVKAYAQDHDLTKTQVVREALAQYFSKKDAQKPYDLGEDLFGQEGSGNKDASVDYKDSFNKHLDEKHAR